MDTGVVASLRRLSAAIGLAAVTTLPTLAAPAAAAPFVPSAGLAVPASENGVIAVRDWRRSSWDRDRYWRRGYDHHRGFNRGAGVALGLGVGLPLAAYLATRPAYDAYDYGPSDYYDRPYILRRVPRPVYRTYSYANSHVQWCYGRYRSYRAYDNTFQPNYGPRRECYSPYD